MHIVDPNCREQGLRGCNFNGHQVFDLMGYPPSHENKINIHIGGVYKDKATTLERFAANFKRLSAGARRRLTVENDDIANSYSITDLLPLSRDTGIPLVRACSGTPDSAELGVVLARACCCPPRGKPASRWRAPLGHPDCRRAGVVAACACVPYLLQYLRACPCMYGRV